MSTGSHDRALPPGPSNAEPVDRLHGGWRAVTTLLAVGVFTEAVFAGTMLSGVAGARAAHGLTAAALIVAATVAGFVAMLMLRRVPQGRRLGLILLIMAATLFGQMALGRASAHGAQLMWLHVPLGVALMVLAMQAVATGRRLGAGMGGGA
jgi:hypothetical protein